MAETILLNKIYKDHTVQNPVDDLSNLPVEAITVHNQAIRNLHVTIQILDEGTGEVLETITGLAEDGDIKAESDSLIRRTCNLTLAVTDDLFPQTGSLIWFNRIAKVYLGIRDNSKKDSVINFLAGTFWVSKGGYTINSSESRLSVTLEDKMMKYAGSKLENPLRIDIDTPIHIAMRMIMEHLGETEFGYIEESRQEEVVPYTLEFNIGDDVTKIIETLRDMYMDYYCGYDVNGRFEFKRIETQREEDIPDAKWDFDVTNENIRTMISFTEDYSLKDIKNRILVFGGTSEKTGITPEGEARVTDSKSPFNVYAIGEKKNVIVEKKYVTDEQCIARARYETWINSTFKEVCNINTVPIYLLDLNDIINVRHPKTGVEAKYMVDSFSYGMNVNSTMTIQAHKIYYVTLEYGKEKLPIIEAIIKGINNYGWISLAEERIAACYNMMGSGEAKVNMRFQEVTSGGEQMSVTSYATTKNQTFAIDIADFENLIMENNENGYIEGRSTGDSLERVISHETFHLVLNDYLGHDKAIQVPTWFNEGCAEFTHGAKERFLAAYSGFPREVKKQKLIDLAKEVVNGNFAGTSEDYVASYLSVIAVYRLASKAQWKNLFIRLKAANNIGINFLYKILPIGADNAEVTKKLLDEVKNMTDVWNFLFDTNDKDTGSVGGIHFMNLYGIPLTTDTVFNNASASEVSIGFKIQFVQ